MAPSSIPGFSQVSVKQRTLQFLISRCKLLRSRRSVSLYSSTSTLASRMFGREDPCGRDRSRCLIPPCLPRCFLLCWGGCIDGSRNGLACLCGRGCSWCLSPPPFPQCLFQCLHLKTLTGQAIFVKINNLAELTERQLEMSAPPSSLCGHRLIVNLLTV